MLQITSSSLRHLRFSTASASAVRGSGAFAMRMLACCWLVLMAQHCSRRSVCRADGGVHYAKVKLYPLASSPGAVAYAPASAADTPLPVISVPSVATCAELCSRAAGGTCRSFNFVGTVAPAGSSASTSTSASGTGNGDCELHATSVWDPQDLRAGPADNPRGTQMWIAATETETASYYRIIPTVTGYAADEFSVWRTDCDDPAYVGSGSELSGILVGLRHGLVHTGTGDTDLEQVKCRMLRRRVGLDRTRPAMRGIASGDPHLACPDGSVITALAEWTAFQAADMIKCVRLTTVTSPPPLTTLMLTDCYDVTLGGNSGKLLDPGMATPAATKWKAECGSPTSLEAMTKIRLHASDLNLIVSFECCRVP